jgi:hypothetical protein
MKRRALLAGIVAALAGAGILGHRVFRGAWRPEAPAPSGHPRRTVADVLEKIGPAAEARLRPLVERAGVAWPPPRVTLVAFKQEKQLELWAAADGRWVFVRAYPILAASGQAGPKLHEGDRQVPEGVYRLTDLNPNSGYHLSMRVDYPSATDRARAAAEGRMNLGGDIFIHGKDVSIGCLAMGDEAIEELFVLVAQTGLANVEVILAPNDLRGGRPAAEVPGGPPWVAELYDDLRKRLDDFPPPNH